MLHSGKVITQTYIGFIDLLNTYNTKNPLNNDLLYLFYENFHKTGANNKIKLAIIHNVLKSYYINTEEYVDSVIPKFYALEKFIKSTQDSEGKSQLIKKENDYILTETNEMPFRIFDERTFKEQQAEQIKREKELEKQKVKAEQQRRTT